MRSLTKFRSAMLAIAVAYAINLLSDATSEKVRRGLSRAPGGVLEDIWDEREWIIAVLVLIAWAALGWWERKSGTKRKANNPAVQSELRRLYRTYGDPAYNAAHELLGWIQHKLSEQDGMSRHYGILLERFISDADRQARSRLATNLLGDGPGRISDTAILQRMFGEYYEKYQWLRTWIHHGSQDLKVTSLPGPPFGEWKRLQMEWQKFDEPFLTELRRVAGTDGFETLAAEVARVGWG